MTPDEVLNGYKNIKKTITNRLNEFSLIAEKKEVFYELCFCLLTPQSNAKRCANAVETLRKNKFYSTNLDEEFIQNTLKGNARFHNNKSRYLKSMKLTFDELWNLFDFQTMDFDYVKAREWLVKNVKGIGLKEASHFLRNVGAKNLAILDRHILKNLVNVKVIPEIPKSLGKNTYFLIEKSFKKYGDKVGLSMDELDLYFWYNETGEVFK